ncbi:MAG TPA: HAMP domain-containing sensor histidine kinase, partial [Sphingobacteriaceae bacterium]
MKKDEFIGIASHELKTPLTSIKAYIQLLDRSSLGEKERTFVSKANSNIVKLNSLISDLLDVSKIQAGRLQFNVTAFPLHEMIEESIENVQHMYTTHRIIRPEVIPDLIIRGDKLRLEQALTNFLVNAVKYSPGANK